MSRWPHRLRAQGLLPARVPVPATVHAHVDRASWVCLSLRCLHCCSMNLELKWTTNTRHPSNKFTMFPPPLMTAVASLQSSPSSWSLEQVDHLLCCCLSWSTTTVPPAPVSLTPVDSGYSSSPASPFVFTTSSVPFDLSFDAAMQTSQAESSPVGVQTSHVMFKSPEDASTLSVHPVSTSAACQTAPSPTSATDIHATPLLPISTPTVTQASKTTCSVVLSSIGVQTSRVSSEDASTLPE